MFSLLKNHLFQKRETEQQQRLETDTDQSCSNSSIPVAMQVKVQDETERNAHSMYRDGHAPMCSARIPASSPKELLDCLADLLRRNVQA